LVENSSKPGDKLMGSKNQMGRTSDSISPLSLTSSRKVKVMRRHLNSKGFNVMNAMDLGT
jgi:hypothetical protein